MLQLAGKKRLDRKDHVWEPLDDGRFLCVLCGALTKEPPEYPTPKDWLPELNYTRLTGEEKKKCQYVPGIIKP